MDINPVINELSKNKIIFQSLFENLPSDFYLWREGDDKWNLLEILCHLYDEERDDFRNRVQNTLENPQAPFTPIEPGKWVTSRKYSEQNYAEKLKDFLAERDNSIKYLSELQNPQWENEHIHPKFGAMKAKMFLYNWLAHDYLHIRQIIRVKYNYFKEVSGEKFDYAGELI
ncbi:MAG: DinB family protein [Bacteroidetes bacterium]|nr:DinB family protein [Bacteroidota bacterium]